ncbi:MAG: hypothetical protein HYZ08_01825 [Candidatus Kerfeldbacteria bacterium]|nr:hypothetical protein [Candidatus Kerfeldbacteria bacterium]
MNHDHLHSTTSVRDMELAGRKVASYWREALLPLIGMLLLQLLLFWMHVSRIPSRIVQLAMFALLPFLLFRPSQWTIQQLLLFSSGIGVIVGFETGMFRWISDPSFANFFELLIQPVFGVAGAILASGFIFLFVLPIIKKVKKRIHSSRRNHGATRTSS